MLTRRQFLPALASPFCFYPAPSHQSQLRGSVLSDIDAPSKKIKFPGINNIYCVTTDSQYSYLIKKDGEEMMIVSYGEYKGKMPDRESDILKLTQCSHRCYPLEMCDLWLFHIIHNDAIKCGIMSLPTSFNATLKVHDFFVNAKVATDADIKNFINYQMCGNIIMKEGRREQR